MTMQKNIFGTDGIRGRVGEEPITADFVLKLGWAFGQVINQNIYTMQIQSKLNKSLVLIGKDTRISGYIFESALEAGLAAAGIDVFLLGPMPTPAIAYLTRSMKASAGIVISASHNSYLDNGIKFFDANGYKLSAEIEEKILDYLQLPMQTTGARALGKVKRLPDARGRYIEFCKQTFPRALSLQGLKIILDSANGAAYQVASQVFSELGAEIVEIFNHPDGFNINQNCGATAPDTLQEKVLETHADLGIALDGDGDRLIMVDDKGEILDGDDILYIIAKWRHKKQKSTSGVVGTIMSNLGFEREMNKMGIAFERVAVGDKHVMQRLRELDWSLGGESSGHIICLDHHTTGDGIISALQVLIAVQSSGQSLSALRQNLRKFNQVVLNAPINEADKFNIVDNARVQEIINSIKAEFVKLDILGRILVRPSGTEDVVRIMVEADLDLDKVQQWAQVIAAILVEESKCHAKIANC